MPWDAAIADYTKTRTEWRKRMDGPDSPAARLQAVFDVWGWPANATCICGQQMTDGPRQHFRTQDHIITLQAKLQWPGYRWASVTLEHFESWPNAPYMQVFQIQGKTYVYNHVTGDQFFDHERP